MTALRICSSRKDLMACPAGSASSSRKASHASKDLGSEAMQRLTSSEKGRANLHRSRSSTYLRMSGTGVSRCMNSQASTDPDLLMSNFA